MVRATAAEIKKLFHGTWPAGITDASVADILAALDYKLDAYVRKHYETALSATGTAEVHIANMMGRQEVLRGVWAMAGGSANADIGPEPELFTSEIVTLIEAVITDTTRDGASTINLSKGRNE